MAKGGHIITPRYERWQMYAKTLCRSQISSFHDRHTIVLVDQTLARIGECRSARHSLSRRGAMESGGPIPRGSSKRIKHSKKDFPHVQGI